MSLTWGAKQARQAGPEIIRGLSLEDYIASPHVSHSMLRDYDKLGPRGYFLRHVHGSNRKAQTKAMATGQSLEDMLTGRYGKPAIIPSEVLVTVGKDKGQLKPWNGNRKDCQMWLEANPGAISQEEYDNLVRMRDAVMENATAKSLLERAEEQVTLRGAFPGLPGTQSRPDWLLLDDAVYVDLKKCQTLEEFRRYGVHKYGCVTQAGMCSRNLRQNDIRGTRFYLLVVEEQFPNRAVLQQLTQHTVATGEKWCTERMQELADHYESGHWPSTVNDVEDLDAPVRGVELDMTGGHDGSDSE